MDAAERMLAEHACARLCHLYAGRLDAYDYERFMELWADGATIVMLRSPLVGEAAIRGWLARREPDMICRHLVTNVVIDVIDADHARGSCYCIAFRARHMRGKEPGEMETPTFIVEYRDEFLHDARRGWLFARREVVASFRSMDA